MLHLAGEDSAALCQVQLFKRFDRKALFVRKAQVIRADRIAAALLQAQDDHAVFLAVVFRLFHVGDDRPVNFTGGIDIIAVCDPVDIDRIVILRNSQAGLDLLVGNAVVKRQHDVRSLVLTGSFHRNICRSAAAFQRKRLRGIQHQSIFRVILQRYGLHERRHAVVLPVPFRQALEQAVLNVPAAALFEVGIDDMRHEHPHPRIDDLYVYADHRAEVDVHVIESLLHALADTDARDREGRLSADDEVDVRNVRTDPADDREIARELYPALDDTVGTHAKIYTILRVIYAAERAQLDGGIQNDGVDRIVRQIELELLRAAEIDPLVGRSVISPFLSVEQKGIAKAVDDLPGLAHADKTDVRRLEGDLARPKNDVARALNQVQVGARQRAAQLERGNGKVVAVHCGGQVLEARAAAVELPDGDGRDERDAGAGLDIEPQLVGDEQAVLFAAFQRKRSFRFKEVEGVQLQLEGVSLLALEGVDLALNLCQLQRHQLFGVKAARSMYAVDLELVFLI